MLRRNEPALISIVSRLAPTPTARPFAARRVCERNGFPKVGFGFHSDVLGHQRWRMVELRAHAIQRPSRVTENPFFRT